METGKELPRLVETYTTKEIMTALEIARKRRFFTCVFGGTGRSKTLTAKHFAATRPDVVLVELESAVGGVELVRRMASAVLGQEFDSLRRNKAELTAYLKRHERMIIVDEANQLLFSDQAKTTAKSLEFLRRDIYDLGGAAVTLIFTSYTINDFRHGRLSDFLEQLRGRSHYPTQIPARVFKRAEVLPILSAYVPEPSAKLLDTAHAIASGGDGKIRTLVKYLDLAAEYVEGHGGAITPELLASLRDRYESGGVWPEE